MSSANLFAEVQLKLSNEKDLRTGEPHTYVHIAFLQSFHKYTMAHSSKRLA